MGEVELVVGYMGEVFEKVERESGPKRRVGVVLFER